MKIFYLHVPKTAGSSINKFFSNNLDSYHFHIEGVKGLNKNFCDSYEFISGHLPYTRMDKILPLEDWTKIVSFREPLSYVISHLSWVRKLADPGEETRFHAHPEPFQRIAKKMTEYDFSNPSELRELVSWLESEDLLFLHNTQMYFMIGDSNRSSYSDFQVNNAMDNLESMDFVGVQEELGLFLNILSKEFGWPANQAVSENVNSNKYGLDINDEEVCKALLPLCDKDFLVYERAKKIFKHQVKYLKLGYE